jgi:hypothetical protein
MELTSSSLKKYNLANWIVVTHKSGEAFIGGGPSGVE